MPMFQRRHYYAIAATLRRAKPTLKGHYPMPGYDAMDRWHIIVRFFADKFREDNPGFKVEQFRSACGVED